MKILLTVLVVIAIGLVFIAPGIDLPSTILPDFAGVLCFVVAVLIAREIGSRSDHLYIRTRTVLFKSIAGVLFGTGSQHLLSEFRC